MMRNFTFPETLPEDIDELRYMHGVSASNEYFEATIEKLVSKLLHSKPFNSDEQLLKEAQAGSASAMNTVGLHYELGLSSLPVDCQEAFSFYSKSAATGDVGALYNLGDVYERCEKDLSLVYDYGIEDKISQKNADEAGELLHRLAVECYVKAAEKNFAPAIYRLGNFAEDAADFESALKLYKSASDLNYPPAQNALGYYKMNGIMTSVDRKSAMNLYEKAAGAKYAPAIYNYAHAMELEDIEKAARCYSEIAYLIPQASFALAQIYERSLHDLRLAINYYRIAYEGGIRKARENLRHCQDILFGKK